MILHEKLVQLRKTRGVTQERLAEVLNVSRQTIYKWERGEAVPGFDKMVQLSRFYQISVESLTNADAPLDSEKEQPAPPPEAGPAQIQAEVLSCETLLTKGEKTRKTPRKVYRWVAVALLGILCLTGVFFLGWRFGVHHSSMVGSVTTIDELPEDDFDLSSARRFKLGE